MPAPPPPPASLLILVDGRNAISSARALGLGIDWEKLREALVKLTTGRALFEVSVYASELRKH